MDDNDKSMEVVPVIDSDQMSVTVTDVTVTLYGSICLTTLASLALTERFADLPGALVGFASGWPILRRESFTQSEQAPRLRARSSHGATPGE